MVVVVERRESADVDGCRVDVWGVCDDLFCEYLVGFVGGRDFDRVEVGRDEERGYFGCFVEDELVVWGE